MTLQSLPQGPFIRGITASNQPLAQPKGSIARGSNLLLSSRGALDVCDGSQLVHAFNGLVQNSRGKFMCAYLFAPTGVISYYMALAKNPSQHLGAPQNLAATLASGGSLSSGTQYFYKVTALDGAGGETTVSNEVSATPSGGNLSVKLTWNIVPNATQYNVYRGTATNTEVLLVGSATAVLPVSQVPFGTLAVTFTDDGTPTFGTTFNLLASPNGASRVVVSVGGGLFRTTLTYTLTGTPTGLSTGQNIQATGVTPADFDGTSTINFITGNSVGQTFYGGHAPSSETGGGGSISTGGTAPPSSDTTQQTVLYQMPLIVGSPAMLPVNYNDSNIVAFFPADPRPILPGGGGGGGGGGNPAGGGGSPGGGTPSGGIPGNVSLIPQMEQFTNRLIIALGNGFAPQIFSDGTGTTVNPTQQGTISTVTVDAFGVVTVTTTVAHGIPTSQVGANVVLQNILNPLYNTNGNGAPAFVIIAVPSTTTFKIFNPNAIGAGSSSGGTFTVSTAPIISTFTPAYPVWSVGASYAAGDLIVPKTQPTANIYLTCIQSGTTGTVEPSWPTGGAASIGAQIVDGGTANAPGIIWQVAGLLNSAAPPPPGAAHIAVYSGALWVFNTSPSNTASGIDGPTSLRMSSIGNPNSWNPVNQAFLDKDDGSEGMGLAKFTITAQGIPPEGSLVAFKNWSPYQIIGVFGATNLQIQAVSSDMGCISPRTLRFVPGFGIARYTHLGIAMFNGVQDQLISEQIRPYLFPSNDSGFADITVVDANFISIAWAALTATPPMYCVAAPIGNSQGVLTRLFCYDLVLKAWMIVDLPFGISITLQARSLTANPVTILGGFNDGVLQRWQSQDLQWYTGGQAPFPQNVVWSYRTLTAASQDTDQRIYVRRLVVTGINSGASGTISASIRQSGQQVAKYNRTAVANSDFDADIPVQLTGKRFDAVISGSINVEIDGDTFEIEPRPSGVVVGV